MSDKTNDGGPAFPVPMFARISDGQLMCASEFGLGGMTLRDYFSAHALSAMTCAPDYSKGPCNGAIAARAYVIADAMLVQRSITGKQ